MRYIMKSKKSKSRKENRTGFNLILRCCLFVMLILAGNSLAFAQTGESATADEEDKPEARVTGLRYIGIHVLQLEKSLKLYQEILGFKMDDAEVFHGPGLEGMLVMRLKADDLTITLSLTAPEYRHQIGPVGNTNHNHFMLIVNDIKTIGDKLKEEGYELENENYARDKYTFFTGPNGEIIGLSSW